MQFNKKVVILTTFSLCLLIFGWVPADSFGNELSQQPLSGTILMHVSNRNCYDFTYSFSDNTLQKTHKGKVFIEEKNQRHYKACQGSTYRDTWKQVYGFPFLDEIQFNSMFGEYDLSLLKKLTVDRDRKDCDPHKTFQLKKRQYGTSEGVFWYHFKLNQQRTYAIYTPQYGPGLLIDLSRMEASVAFCNDELGHLAWNKSGQYIAYITPNRIMAPHQRLVVRDMSTKATVLEKTLERWGGNIAWSPSSEHIAVLSYSTRLGFLWPWELLSAIAGHPIPHISFYLSVYDITGKELLTHKIIGNVVYGTGSIIWVEQ